MELKNRILLGNKNIIFLQNILADVKKEINALQEIEKDYFQKVVLIQKCLRGERKYKEISKLEKKIRKRIEKDRKGETKLENIFSSLLNKIDRALNAQLGPYERAQLLKFRSVFAGQRRVIVNLRQILEQQHTYFSNPRAWDTKENLNHLLQLIQKEGTILGWDNKKAMIAEKSLLDDEIKFEKIRKKDFRDVFEQEYNIGNIKGSLFAKKGNVSFKAGVVLVHGIFADRYELSKLAKRLCLLDYLVYAIDIPGHISKKSDAPTAGKLSYGLISEYILISVQFLACVDVKAIQTKEEAEKNIFTLKIQSVYRKIRKVAVVGHSLGAAGAAFACYNYTTNIEKELYSLGQKYIELKELLEITKKALNKKDENEGSEERIKQIGYELESIYSTIKRLILYSLKNYRFNNSQIDAVVFAAPPKTVQTDVPPKFVKLFAYIPKAILKIPWHTFVWDDKPHLVNYFINVKNTSDYLENISFFSEPRNLNLPNELKENIEKEEKRRLSISKDEGGELPAFTFMAAYKKRIIEPIPKLMINGGLDIVNRAFIKSNKYMLEHIYAMSGNLKIITIPGMSHWLNPSFFNFMEGLTSDLVGKEIVDFLELNLAGKHIIPY